MKQLITALLMFVSVNAVASQEVASASLRLVSIDISNDVELTEAVSAALLVNKAENTLAVTFFKNDAINRVFQVISVRRFVNLEVSDVEGCGILTLKAVSEDGLTQIQVRDYSSLVCRMQVEDKTEVTIIGENYTHSLAGDELSPIFE